MIRDDRDLYDTVLMIIEDYEGGGLTTNERIENATECLGDYVIEQMMGFTFFDPTSDHMRVALQRLVAKAMIETYETYKRAKLMGSLGTMMVNADDH